MNYPPYGYQYQPYQNQPMNQPMQPPQQAQNGMIWVNGINDAMNYPVCPNAAVNLWDSTAPCVYVKSADATGKPSMKIYDLVERKQAAPVPVQNVDYITREEFDSLVAKVNQIASPGKKASKKEESVNESAT